MTSLCYAAWQNEDARVVSLLMAEGAYFECVGSIPGLGRKGMTDPHGFQAKLQQGTKDRLRARAHLGEGWTPMLDSISKQKLSLLIGQGTHVK